MSFFSFFSLEDANVRFVLLGCVILSVIASLVGSFSFFRKRALVGDAVAHGLLPGICLSFLFTQKKEGIALLIGALCSGWIALLCIEYLTKRTKIKQDTALALTLSIFFGLGIYLLTYIQQNVHAEQSGLDTFLFGKAAAMIMHDVWMFSVLATTTFIGILMCFRGFIMLSFNAAYGQGIGLPMRGITHMLNFLTILTIILGIQTVGIVLMVALLIAPSASARFWTRKLHTFLFISIGIGALSSIIGVYISYAAPHMPTGPWIVVTLSLLALISFLFGTHNGWLKQRGRMGKGRKQTHQENVLKGFYDKKKEEFRFQWTPSALEKKWKGSMSLKKLKKTLRQLSHRKEIAAQKDGWTLLPLGEERATQIIKRHRLWESYLHEKLTLPAHKIHEEAERIEHVLDTTLDEKLQVLMGSPQKDPHNKKIPYKKH